MIGTINVAYILACAIVCFSVSVDERISTIQRINIVLCIISGFIYFLICTRLTQ